MAAELDRTEQRIVGVLIEKELSVPDSYPLSANALLAGCNQKSNRDPFMELLEFEVNGALLSLRMKEWIEQTDRAEGGRVRRYRHQVERRLGVDAHEKAVLAELLLRGPQAPGALKPRVARMGYEASPEQIEALLVRLRDRGLVEQLDRQPRERDHRWAHTLGPRDEAALSSASSASSASDPAPDPTPEPPARKPLPGAPPAPAATGSSATAASGSTDLERRVAVLEGEIRRLREIVLSLQAEQDGSGVG